MWEEHDEKGLEKLVGRTITKIQMDEDNLIFTTNDGKLGFTVEGDCCSSSYFHDFYGVSNLLGKKVKEVGTVSLETPDQLTNNDWDDIKVYGFKLVFEGEYGDQTAVFSFRNRSNGYYGGWMFSTDNTESNVPEITKDTVLL